jgi:hypothetical protein
MTSQALWSTSQVAGVLLILGSVLVLSGAGSYAFVKDKGGPLIFGQPPREWLRLVGEHPSLWRWATLLFITGPIVTVMGFGLFTTQLRGAGDPGFAQLGMLAVALGAALWVVNLAARLTVDPWAARIQAQMGAIPESYTAISSWTGALYVVYTILTFTALVLYGWAMLTATLLLHWVGWASICYGLAGLIFFAIARDAPPFLHYLMPILLGALLLLS